MSEDHQTEWPLWEIFIRGSHGITASSPGEKEALYDPSSSKIYRHPTFFPMPEEIKGM